jgi:hypothetical protein
VQPHLVASTNSPRRRDKTAHALLAAPVVVGCVDEGDAVVEDRVSRLLLRGPSADQALPARLADNFLGEAFLILRDYRQGRTVLSAIVTVVTGLAALLLGLPLVFTIIVVHFIGGYIPLHLGFPRWRVAVMIAWERVDQAWPPSCSWCLRLQPLAGELCRAQGHGPYARIHPLVVLVVTALGGLLGGIVGLILARACHRDRRHRHRPASVERCYRRGRRPC